MITLLDGNVFESQSQVLVNTVNVVCTMGKGLALKFKLRYPRMFDAYRLACQQGHIKVGKIFVWKNTILPDECPEYVFNFPTKKHWKDDSKIEYIIEGLEDTKSLIKRLKIESIAFPALGCGLGNLSFYDEVFPQIQLILGDLDTTNVFVYKPQ